MPLTGYYKRWQISPDTLPLTHEYGQKYGGNQEKYLITMDKEKEHLMERGNQLLTTMVLFTKKTILKK